jgi:dipeptidyl aminopeptidase/acylaminoacyl peptidase
LRRLISADDLYGYRYVSDPQLSPDGARVAYVLAWIDRESDEYRSAVYVAPSDGSAESVRFTSGVRRDHSPRWSPDGSRLLFVSDREEAPQVYVMPADGGEARRLTHAEHGAGSPAWSPDGRCVAFLSATGYPADQDTGDILAYHYTEAHFKDDGKGIRRGRTHLFVQDLDAEDARQLTHGDDDYAQPAWRPDGTAIAVVSAQRPDRAFVPASDICLVPAGSGEPRRLTPGDGPATAPTFSPDGSRIAYFGHRNPPETGMSTNTGLWVIPVAGGNPVHVTEGWDRSIGAEDVNSDSRWGSNDHRPVWSPDGARLSFLATDRGAMRIYSVGADGGAVRAVTSGQRVVYAFSAARDRLAYYAAGMLEPGDVYASRVDGSGETRLTRVNADLLAGFALASPEEVRIPSTEGVELQGWAIRPVGYGEGDRSPLVIEVHGGPHTAYGHAWFHEFQVLAARGYGVLFTNPRGSVGYGQAFAACIAREWGERDWADVSAAADWAAAQPWVDPERLGIVGGSYGGWMALWAVGHTDRFRAAVAQRCLSSWTSFYGTSDIGPWFAEWMAGGTPWSNPEGYARMSPVTYLDRARTPTLVIHSEEDHRCPVEQGEQAFVALSRAGVETEFVRFPQENHNLTRGGKPARRVESLRRTVAWLDRFLGSGE